MSLVNTHIQQAKQKIMELTSLSDEQFGEDDNFFKLGIDSMHLMALLSQFRRAKIAITLRQIYDNPTLIGLRELLEKHEIEASKTSNNNTNTNEQNESLADLVQATHTTMLDGKPFPMTSVQHAYYVGRSAEQTLGGICCHFYQEFEGQGLALVDLDRAVNTLIQRHPHAERSHFSRWTTTLVTKTSLAGC